MLMDASSVSHASHNRSASPDNSQYRTSTQVNYETLDSVFKRIKPWFCETRHPYAWDTLKFLICKHAGASNEQLIERFHDLKALAGDGYQGMFSIEHGCKGSVYKIELGDDAPTSWTFKISSAPPPSDRSYKKLVWAAGAGVGAIAAYGYFYPDFREKAINHLCQEVYGVLTCSYDAHAGWQEFALNLGFSGTFSDFLQASTDRVTSAAEVLASGLNAWNDASGLVNFVATLPAAAVKHAYAIACWQLQLHVTKITWNCISGWLFQSNGSETPSRCQAVVNVVGTYFSSVPYLRLKGMCHQLVGQCLQSQAPYPKAADCDALPMAALVDGRP